MQTLTQAEHEILRRADEIRNERTLRGPGVNYDSATTPSREPTVSENILSRIEQLRLHIKTLQDLHDNLPKAFLDSVQSRLML